MAMALQITVKDKPDEDQSSTSIMMSHLQETPVTVIEPATEPINNYRPNRNDGNTSNRTIGQQIPQSLQEITSATFSTTWQYNKDARLRVIKMLIQELQKLCLPNVDTQKRMELATFHASKLEFDTLQLANNKLEYYQKLANKIYQIKKSVQIHNRMKKSQQDSSSNTRKGLPEGPNNLTPLLNPPAISAVLPHKEIQIPPPDIPAPISSMSSVNSPRKVKLPFFERNIINNDTGSEVVTIPTLQSPKEQQYPKSSIEQSDSLEIQEIDQQPVVPLQKTIDVLKNMVSTVNKNPPSADQPPDAMALKTQEEVKITNTLRLKDSPRSMSSVSSIVKEEPKSEIDEPITPMSVVSTSVPSPLISEPESKEVPRPCSQPPNLKKVVIKPEVLRQVLMPTLKSLYRQYPESVPFREPVDPVALQIPDYPKIIKNPMDLSTIKHKLDTGQYEDPWQYVDDMNLMFDNAWLFNRKEHAVYRHCTKLAEVFKKEIDPVMRTLGYCCGQKYVFKPDVLYCYSKMMCVIPRNTYYWNYQNSYTYCQRCFAGVAGEFVTVSDCQSDSQTLVEKNLFVKMKNEVIHNEEFVECGHCGRKFHQICVLHLDTIWPDGFTCDKCLNAKRIKRKENKFSAKRLLQCKLGSFIEDRVNNWLKEKKTDAGEVIVRVLSCWDKVFEVKSAMKERFVDIGKFPAKLPYRDKAIFAFQKINSVEVCFFGMHVQEYGSECPEPNTRKIYISYLDSVQCFQPKQYRSEMYHEILLGYFDYVKRLGYCTAHIWACPPNEGDDYIFRCHPPEQKIPKPKRLQDWYQTLLDKGVAKGIVFNHMDILKYAIEVNVSSVAELPYFDGDFWPNILEEIIKELEEEQKMSKTVGVGLPDVTKNWQKGIKSKSTEETKIKRSKGKRKSQPKYCKKSHSPVQGDDFLDKIYATMEKHKKSFLVVQLHSPKMATDLPPIKDPDCQISCDLMDTRDSFLSLSRLNHFEFSSIRRIKFSTMAMLYEIHQQIGNGFNYNCNVCKTQVETRYHCNICDDYDLCIACYKSNGHQHKMEKLGFDLDGSSSNDQKQVEDPASVRRQSIQRCEKFLLHACQCRDANCHIVTCLKMKKVLQHYKICKGKTKGRLCSICNQFVSLCCHHAKHCRNIQCIVPSCIKIRSLWNQRKLKEQLQQEQMLKRRVANMNNELVEPLTSLSPRGRVPNQHEQKSDIEGDCSKEIIVIPVVLATTAEPRPTDKTAAIKDPPQVMTQISSLFPAKAKVARMRGPILETMAQARNESLMALEPSILKPLQCQNNGKSNSETRAFGQPNTETSINNQLQPKTNLSEMNQSNSAMVVNGGVDGSKKPNNLTALQVKQVLSYLIETLRKEPQQRHIILNILRSNPQLMAEFIRVCGKFRQQQVCGQTNQQGEKLKQGLVVVSNENSVVLQSQRLQNQVQQHQQEQENRQVKCPDPFQKQELQVQNRFQLQQQQQQFSQFQQVKQPLQWKQENHQSQWKQQQKPDNQLQLQQGQIPQLQQEQLKQLHQFQKYQQYYPKQQPKDVQQHYHFKGAQQQCQQYYQFQQQRQVQGLQHQKHEVQGFQHQVQEPQHQQHQVQGFQHQVQEPQHQQHQVQGLQQYQVQGLQHQQNQVQGLQQYQVQGHQQNQVQGLQHQQNQVHGLQQRQVQGRQHQLHQVQGLQLQQHQVEKLRYQQYHQVKRLKTQQVQEFQQQIQGPQHDQHQLQGLKHEQHQVQGPQHKQHQVQGPQHEQHQVQGLQHGFQQHQVQGLQQHQVQGLKHRQHQVQGLKHRQHHQVQGLKYQQHQVQGPQHKQHPVHGLQQHQVLGLQHEQYEVQRPQHEQHQVQEPQHEQHQVHGLQQHQVQRLQHEQHQVQGPQHEQHHVQGLQQHQVQVLKDQQHQVQGLKHQQLQVQRPQHEQHQVQGPQNEQQQVHGLQHQVQGLQLDQHQVQGLQVDQHQVQGLQLQQMQQLSKLKQSQHQQFQGQGQLQQHFHPFQ